MEYVGGHASPPVFAACRIGVLVLAIRIAVGLRLGLAYSADGGAFHELLLGNPVAPFQTIHLLFSGIQYHQRPSCQR